MALSTGKIARVMLESAKEMYEQQMQLLTLTDFHEPDGGAMQNSSNFVWSPVQQHAPIISGWDLTGSERGFREAIAAGIGDRAELANNLGLVLRKQGKLTEAVKLFDEALEKNPGMVEALNNRAVAYRKMKRYKEATADLEKVLKADPDSGHAQFNLGTVYEARGQIKEAIRYYRQYLDNPSRTPGLDETLIRQRITALEAEGSSVSWPAGQGRKGR